MLICTWASLEDIVRSYSRLGIRQRPSHANVRSTTQRHLITRNSLLPGGRLVTSIAYQPCSETHSFKEWLWYLLSAHNFFSRGNDSRLSFPSTCGAAVPSSAAALVTVTARSRPSVSTTMCPLRPLRSLPPSKPRGPPISVALTVWLSMLPALGVGSRPAACRTWG